MPLFLSEIEAWAETDEEPNPPTLCEECGEVIEDGCGWYSDDMERLLCLPCKRGEEW